MELSNRTVLVTGGASGIGLALASRFLHAGSTIIICGRRADKLREAQRDLHGAITRVVDLSSAEDRRELRDWAVRAHPSLDVLVNNAGIQRRVPLLEDEPWEQTREEIAINL